MRPQPGSCEEFLAALCALGRLHPCLWTKRRRVQANGLLWWKTELFQIPGWPFGNGSNVDVIQVIDNDRLLVRGPYYIGNAIRNEREFIAHRLIPRTQEPFSE